MGAMDWLIIAQCVWLWCLIIWLWCLIISNVRAKRRYKREAALLNVERAELLVEKEQWLREEFKASLPRLAKLNGITELQAQVALDASNAAALEEFSRRAREMQK